MGKRGEKDPIEKADATRIGKAVEEKHAEADKQRMLATRREAELQRIAGDLPDDPKALWMYAEHSLVQSAVSMIDAGRAFIKLKELLPHGEFMTGLEDRGVSPRSAREIMASARRFADRSDKLLKLGRTKLYACLEFSDDELDALEDGQSVLDLDLDKIDKMTSRELKAALRKRDADAEIQGSLLESKNRQIDDVATELERLKGGLGEQDVSPFVREVESEKAIILIPLMRLKKRACQMEAKLISGDPADRSEYFALQAALDAIRDELAQAMDAAYNAGAPYQSSIARASMPNDADAIQ